MNTKMKWGAFLIILIGGLILLILPGEKKSDKDANPYRFAVEDTSEIRRILLADRSGTIIVLNRQPSHWILNNTYPARQNAIDNLIDVIKRVELKFIPPGVALDHITRDLATNGIKVVVYGKGDFILKSYYVGGVTPDERGTYMIMEGSENPAVTYIPGWEGGLRTRYWMHPIEWRDRTVIGFSFDEIKEITVQYPKHEEESFHLEKNHDQIIVKPLNTKWKSHQGDQLPGTGEAYIMEFKNLSAEAILENQTLADSLKEVVPFAMISVLINNGEVKSIELFPQKEIQTGHRPHIERYYVLSSWGDLYLVQDRIFKRILRGYSYFNLTGKGKVND